MIKCTDTNNLQEKGMVKRAQTERDRREIKMREREKRGERLRGNEKKEIIRRLPFFTTIYNIFYFRIRKLESRCRLH